MALPPQAWEPVATGVLEFINGWALVALLASCKAARGCQWHLQRARAVQQQLEELNAFLLEAIRENALRLPGFEFGKLELARLIAIDPSPALPGRNMTLLLDETYALDPCPARPEYFTDWLADFWPEITSAGPNFGELLRRAHPPGSPLHERPQLDTLASILCRRAPPAYAPSWAAAGRGPVLVNGVEATHYPAFILACASIQGFPVLLYARAKTAAIPWIVIIEGSRARLSRMLGGRRRAGLQLPRLPL